METNNNINSSLEVGFILNTEEELKQISYQLADVNFYREPERFSELFNQFINLSNESGIKGWKNKITCIPFLSFFEEIPFLAFL